MALPTIPQGLSRKDKFASSPGCNYLPFYNFEGLQGQFRSHTTVGHSSNCKNWKYYIITWLNGRKWEKGTQPQHDSLWVTALKGTWRSICAPWAHLPLSLGWSQKSETSKDLNCQWNVPGVYIRTMLAIQRFYSFNKYSRGFETTEFEIAHSTGGCLIAWRDPRERGFIWG